MAANNKIQPMDDKKPSPIWRAFKFLASIFFPIFKLLVINYNLTLCEKTLGKDLRDKNGEYVNPYGWFNKQKRLNILWGLGSLLPIIFGIIFSYVVLSSNPIFIKGINAAKREISISKVLKGFGVSDAKRKMEVANQYDPSVNQDIQISFYAVIFGLIISMIIGIMLVYYHPIEKDSLRLRRELERAGIIRPEDNHIVFATAVGFLIDITGSVSREIADSDRIWTSLNVRVNRDVAENPERRSLVFFKRAYELKTGSEYGFDKIPKE
jgi:hypothetical protein